ncbi:MAG TPA: MFS transporter [Candidatus Nanoarchaeia archaeon]|nr:MFS transporter [Candidatus Nanoarchaeia archaeon]
MHPNINDVLARELGQNHSPEIIKQHLERDGYQDEEIEEAISKSSELVQAQKQQELRQTNRIFSFKEVLDRIGFGFVPNPFLNILFNQIGGSYFIIGLVNGLKSSLTLLYSRWIQYRNQSQHYGKNFISKSGILFGFSFFLMSIAILLRNVPLFFITILIAGIGVVTYGDTYQQYRNQQLKKERMTPVLRFLSQYGLILTAMCLLLAGYLLQMYPLDNPGHLTLAGKTYPLYGYLVLFELTALCFILGGYVLSKLHDKPITTEEQPPFWRMMREHLAQFQNPRILLLSLAGIVLGATQVLANTYYGLHIYHEFQHTALEGFLNIALIYFIALLAALAAPSLVQKIHQKIGITPLLVFGTLLTTLPLLAFLYNPNLYAIGIANTLAVIGATTIGVGHDYLTKKLLREKERISYFTSLNMTAVLPFLLLTLGGAYLAQQDILLLFKTLLGLLILVVFPLYFTLVILANRRNPLPT